VAVLQEKMTLEEFLELPEREPALEFEEGTVTQKVSPKGKHSAIQLGAAQLVNRMVRPSRVARAFTELRTTFAGRSYVPDVSVYRWGRIAVDANGEIADVFREPPDVTVEIVSPKQSLTKLVRRCLWYAAHGVPVALLVDPIDKTILLFRSGQTVSAIRGDQSVDLSDAVPGLRFAAQELFDELSAAR
jgi:Uma2 family endonuclease